MYATCLFCNGPLGANEAIEPFPVGQRLAFDAAKGRLWVVCRRCERWNLSPVEERWEAIEECERRYRDTRLRVSTDNIGLARLREGLELVRIGAPQRPEMAAWRYGDQFGRRRKRKIIRVGIGVSAVGGVVAGLVTAGIATGASLGGAWWALSRGAEAGYRRIVYGDPRAIVARLQLPNGERLPIRRKQLTEIGFQRTRDGASWQITLPHVEWDTLTGEDAFRAAGQLLPALNWDGANAVEITRATELLEGADSVSALFYQAAGGSTGRPKMAKLDTPIRLALEMAAHEESERRALEGELHLLEAAWREAEEIAAIADDMFLPSEVGEFIDKHRGRK
jgi:hypothetical protein